MKVIRSTFLVFVSSTIVVVSAICPYPDKGSLRKRRTAQVSSRTLQWGSQHPDFTSLLSAADYYASSLSQPGSTATVAVSSEGTQSVMNVQNGDWIRYSLGIPEQGEYTFSLRISSTVENGSLQVVAVDTRAVIATFSDLPLTGDMNTWTTVSTNLTLPVGQHMLEFLVVQGGWSLQWLNLVPVNTVASPGVPAAAPVTLAPVAAPVTSSPVVANAPVPTAPAPVAAPVTSSPVVANAPVPTAPAPVAAPVTSSPVVASAPVPTAPTPVAAPVTSSPVVANAPVPTAPAPTPVAAPVTSAPVVANAPVPTAPTPTPVAAPVTSAPAAPATPSIVIPMAPEAMPPLFNPVAVPVAATPSMGPMMAPAAVPTAIPPTAPTPASTPVAAPLATPPITLPVTPMLPPVSTPEECKLYLNASAYASMSGVNHDNTTDYVGWLDPGDWIVYDVPLPPGTYQLDTTAASPEGKGSFLLVDAVMQTPLMLQDDMPMTGDWMTWQVASTVFALPTTSTATTAPFQLEMRIYSDGWNLKSLCFRETTAAVPQFQVPGPPTMEPTALVVSRTSSDVPVRSPHDCSSPF